MTTPIRRRSIAPVLSVAAVADAPTAAAAHPPGGPHFAAVLNAALQEIEHADDERHLRVEPLADVRAAQGPLIVDGIVLPGLRFGG